MRHLLIGRIAYADEIHDTAYEITYDMNGDKGPNRFGYDTFVFEITAKGKMLLYGTSYNNKDGSYCENDERGNGSTCSAKIMNNIKY